MPIFKKDGKMIQDIDWSVLIDRHKVSKNSVHNGSSISIILRILRPKRISN
jgi:hypothetical protein